MLELNRVAARQLTGLHRIEVVPAASHLFEEPGALESVATLAADWFVEHLTGRAASEVRDRDTGVRSRSRCPGTGRRSATIWA